MQYRKEIRSVLHKRMVLDRSRIPSELNKNLSQKIGNLANTIGIHIKELTNFKYQLALLGFICPGIQPIT